MENSQKEILLSKQAEAVEENESDEEFQKECFKFIEELSVLPSLNTDKRLLAEYKSRALAGIDLREAWKERYAILGIKARRQINKDEMNLHYLGPILEGLAGNNSEKARRLRRFAERNLVIGGFLDKLGRKKRSFDFRCPLLESVIGLDTAESWKIRRRFLFEELSKFIKGQVVDYNILESLAKGLAGIDSLEAWEMRAMLSKAGTEEGNIATSLIGLDNEDAWKIRDYLFYKGDITRKKIIRSETSEGLYSVLERIIEERKQKKQKEAFRKTQRLYNRLKNFKTIIREENRKDSLSQLIGGLFGLKSQNAEKIREALKMAERPGEKIETPFLNLLIESLGGVDLMENDLRVECFSKVNPIFIAKGLAGIRLTDKVLEMKKNIKKSGAGIFLLDAYGGPFMAAVRLARRRQKAVA